MIPGRQRPLVTHGIEAQPAGAPSAPEARLLDRDRALPIASALFIRNVLARQRGRLATVFDGAHLVTTRLRLEDLVFADDRRAIRARCPAAAAPLAPGHLYTVALVDAASVTVFESACLGRRGSEVLLAIPEEARQTGVRGRRATVAASLPRLRVSYAEPRVDGRGEGQVREVSAHGLSFETSGARLQRGDLLAELIIALPARRLRGRAIVRDVSQLADAGGPRQRCGIELVGFDSPDDDPAWHDYVFAGLHPQAVDACGRAESVWALLESSRYVELWTPPAERARAHAHYLEAWQTPPRQVGRSVVLEQEGQPLGTVAASLAYPGTWLLHHLARAPRPGDQSHAPLQDACELISAILHRLRAPDFEHFVIYLERDKRWNERLYVDFARRYWNPEQVLLSPLRVFRRATAAPAPAAEGVQVVPSTPELLSRLARRLEATLAPLERRALAYEPGDLDLERFAAACDRHGHERRRQCFFAQVDGVPVAALVAESGGEGVNLFGLLNTCRLIALVDGPLSAAVERALLAAAVAHFRAAGKAHFLLFADDDAPDDLPRALGFEAISAGLRWIAHRDVTPAWAAYLDSLLAAPERAP
jgi:hypothetical protein